MDLVDAGALEFFNRLSGRLEIELTEKPQPITPKLHNVAASPSAKIVRLSLRMQVWEGKDFRELTDAEWSRVVLRAPSIRLRNARTQEVVEARDGVFTVRDLAAAIEETERRSRGTTEWFGGIDVHHRFFEGIRDVGGVWEIDWGS
jgi:hypothetical protein